MARPIASDLDAKKKAHAAKFAPRRRKYVPGVIAPVRVRSLARKNGANKVSPGVVPLLNGLIARISDEIAADSIDVMKRRNARTVMLRDVVTTRQLKGEEVYA